MQSGKLRNLVEIQEKIVTRQANGEENRTWITFAQAWAEISPLSGRELLTLRDEMAQVTTRIKTRYLAGVTAEMRVVHGGSVYEITEVIDRENRGAELELLCLSEAVPT